MLWVFFGNLFLHFFHERSVEIVLICISEEENTQPESSIDGQNKIVNTQQKKLLSNILVLLVSKSYFCEEKRLN